MLTGAGMPEPRAFRRHLAARLLAAVLPPLVAASTSGCCFERSGTALIEDWPEDLSCPPEDEAAFYMDGYASDLSCGSHIHSIDGPGKRTKEGCEYPITDTHCSCMNHGFGRPYRDEDEIVTAPPARRADWSGGDIQPDVTGLSSEERRAQAARFRRQALLEHASIASFARVALALMTAGAPPELVAGTHRAALDEVEHARACFALAGAFSGEAEGPGRFPIHPFALIDGDLAKLAADTMRDGCIEETLSTIEAAEALAEASDPAVRAVLARIVADEAGHAELAFRTVLWAISAGGAPVVEAVTSVIADAQRATREPGSRRAFAEVVLPAARALLGLLPNADGQRAGVGPIVPRQVRA